MDRRLSYLEDVDDVEVDSLLSQLGDANILKLKVNTHSTSSRVGFEYPTFTEGWVDEDATEALDTQLSSRFSSLKHPIAPKKKGNDCLKAGGKKGSNSERAVAGGQKGHHGGRESQFFEKKSGDADGMGFSSKPSSRISSKRQEEDRSSSRRQHSIKRDASRSLSHRTEFYSSFRSSDDSPAGVADEDDEDADSLDAALNERFRALKATPPSSSTSSSTPPSTGNLDLDSIIQISGQLSTNDYASYGSTFSTPSSPSPSANLLGRSKSRSSPRVMTNSVATSCHCSTPSPLKLLKQVGSKSFPSKQQLFPGSLPPLSPAARSSPSVKKPGRQYKVEGFGNSKPVGKDSEKNAAEKKEKTEKIERKNSNEESNSTNPSTMKDMRRLLSSVADRVGLERSRVSSAVDDELFPEEDLNVWSVLDEEQEFARASTEEEKLNREAERVVEWAKDAARLEPVESDMDGDVDDRDEDDGDDDDSNGRKPPTKKEKPKKKGIKVAPKKRWILF